MVNALYPRTIDIHRSGSPSLTTDKGLAPYHGRSPVPDPPDPSGEVVMMRGIQCTIESRGIGRSTGAMTLPGNVSKNPQWRISTVPLPLYTIRDNDILVDDEGYRYQVALNAWTILGYVLDCIRLET